MKMIKMMPMMPHCYCRKTESTAWTIFASMWPLLLSILSTRAPSIDCPV
jgi:hypothetical protein